MKPHIESITIEEARERGFHFQGHKQYDQWKEYQGQPLATLRQKNKRGEWSPYLDLCYLKARGNTDDENVWGYLTTIIHPIKNGIPHDSLHPQRLPALL